MTTLRFDIRDLPARVVEEDELGKWQPVETITILEVGERVAVFSRGRTREGLVEKIGRTKATVVYTTEGAREDAARFGHDPVVTRKAAGPEGLFLPPTS